MDYQDRAADDLSEDLYSALVSGDPETIVSTPGNRDREQELRDFLGSFRFVGEMVTQPVGTLSGGGTEVIAVGEGCLIGANAGIGISLGDRSVVEAGCYITAGSKITLPDGTVVKGRQLSGEPDLLFRRNSVTGALEAVARTGHWGGLNAGLHAND